MAHPGDSISPTEPSGASPRRDFLQSAGIAALAGGLAGFEPAGSRARASAVAAETRAPAGPMRPIIVERIESFKVVVPMQPGSIYSEDFGPNLYDWSFDRIPKFIVRVHTSTGLIGLGETGRGTADRALAENIEFLTGRNLLDLNPADPALGLPHGATSDAFEIAYYDLLGKTLGVPVHVLLGGRFQDRIAVTYWTGQRTVSDLATVAQRAADLGFKHLKFKCRQQDPVVEQTQAARKAVPQMGLTVDFNESYATPAEFLPVARQLEGLDIMLEDPVPRRIDWFRELRENLTNPLVLTPRDDGQLFEAIKEDACDILNLGGPMREFVKAAYLAEAAGIRVWHGSGIELGVRDTSFVHAAAATRSCTIPSDMICYLRESDLLTVPFQVVDGFVPVPRAPGLGVELDEDKLRRFIVAG